MGMIKYSLFSLIMVLISTTTLAADTVKIAAIFALTGRAKTNLNSMEGVRFGVKEINRQGGVLGKRIELLEYDNQSSAIRSNIAAENAADEGVAAIVGPAWSSFAIAVAKSAQAYKIPMITNTATITGGAVPVEIGPAEVTVGQLQYIYLPLILKTE